MNMKPSENPLDCKETQATAYDIVRYMFAYASLYKGLSGNAIEWLSENTKSWYTAPRLYKTPSIVTVHAKYLGWFSFKDEKEKQELVQWARERATQYHNIAKTYGIDPMSYTVIKIWKDTRKW